MHVGFQFKGRAAYVVQSVTTRDKPALTLIESINVHGNNING